MSDFGRVARKYERIATPRRRRREARALGVGIGAEHQILDRGKCVLGCRHGGGDGLHVRSPRLAGDEIAQQSR